MATRRAVVWCLFEVTGDKITDSGLQGLVTEVLGTINESTDILSGIEFKGCKARIVSDGELPPLVPPEE